MAQPLLAQVLGRLHSLGAAGRANPDVIVGTDTFDDAGVFRLNDETALVQTVDFFPPPVDDPYAYGQIAAANALSDVYAMGGRPLTALSIVGFPDKELDHAILVEILRGGADKVAEAGAVLIGGHSVRDAEVKFGLAVTGLVHPKRIFTNAAAQPGDALILTKPLGSGVLTTAYKKSAIDESGLAEAVASMVRLNAPAAEAAHDAGVRAATDVTGFGLLGHAGSMARASNVTLVIDSSKVPLLGDCLQLARQGFVTRAGKATREHLGASLRVAPSVEPALLDVLCDAQTSGGLLLCVAQEQVASLLANLSRRDVQGSAIGQVERTGETSVWVR